MTKTHLKYQSLIKQGKFSERELIDFRRYVNGSSPLSEHDANCLIQDFIDRAENKGIRLTDVQQVKGILWLKNATFKKNGQVRKNPPLGYFEQQVIGKFKEFTCVGLYNLSDNAYRQYVPIYRCISEDGSWFDYACMMWGEIKVLSIGHGFRAISHCNQPEWELARSGKQSLRIIEGGAA